MRVQMLRARTYQDAGCERPLSVGVVYDLPAPIAATFIATGVAVREEAPQTVRELAVTGPAEIKKRGRR